MSDKIMMKVLNHKYEWMLLLLTLCVLNIYCTSFAYNSDTLFPFRYADAIHSPGPVKLIIQPGPRFFPEWLYAYLIRFIVDKASIHLLLMMVLNSMILSTFLILFNNQVFNNTKTSITVTALTLISIPAMNVIYSSDIQYLIFSPGIHGFSLPFIILTLYYCLKLMNNQQLRPIEYFILFLTMLASCLSNQLLLVSLVGPAISSLFLIKFMVPNSIKLKSFLLLFIISLVVIVLTLKADLIWGLIPNIYITPNQETYFQVSLIDWLNSHGSNFFSNFFDHKRTGFVSILVCISVLVSLFKLLQALIKKRDSIQTSLLFINALNLIWWPFILISMWAINKGLIRYIPYILLLSPLVLLINAITTVKAVKTYFSKQNASLTVLLICLFTLLSFPFKSDNFRVHDNSAFNALMVKLKSLEDEKIINDTGLSSYWVAWSGASDFGFNILPVHPSGAPNVFASNALSFWDFSEGTQTTRTISFAINRYIKYTKKWSLDKSFIEARYGPISKTINYQDDRDRIYEIYVFHQVNTNYLYQRLEQIIEQRFFEKSPN